MIQFLQSHSKLLCGIAVVLLAAGLITSWIAGGYLCAPRNHAVALPKDMAVEQVTFRSNSGTTIHGWLLDSQTDRGVVILQHGVRADKSSLVERARFLSEAGYAVLLYDFQAHGESLASCITFGYLESRDAQAAVEFVKRRFPGKPIGVIGLSLGAAAAAMAHPVLDAEALVFEMMYPTVVEATKNRIAIRLGSLGRVLSPMLTTQLKWRIGCTSDDLRPIVSVGKITVPKLFLVGAADRQTTLAESEAIFAHAAEPKTFVSFESARHQDLLAFAPEQYKKVILEFLEKNLK